MTTAGIGKKVKRTGEAALFHEITGKLTDEAFAMCRVSGVNPSDLYSRSIEAFLKNGLTQKDAKRRHIEYEEQRKINVELVLKDMMLANTRMNNRKATSVLSRLTMPHDERMLKSAFKQHGSKLSISNAPLGSKTRQPGSGLSKTPYVSKSMNKGRGLSPTEMSQDFEDFKRKERKQEEVKRMWQLVLDRKHLNADQKGKLMKEQLAKKFRREKEMVVKKKDQLEDKQYKLEQRMEHVQGCVERKIRAEEQVEKKKRVEARKANERRDLASQRRIQLLQERTASQRQYGMQSTRGNETSQIMNNQSSAQNLAPMKQRAYSSTGRTQEHFHQLHEMEEVEAIQNGLQRYQERMLRASELRSKMTAKLTGKMNELTGRVEEKREFKSQKIENDYMSEFTKNVTKREKIEEKKKKLAEEKNFNKEADEEKKFEKLQGVKARQQDNQNKLQKRNKTLEERWNHIKQRGIANMSSGQAALLEKQAAMQELNNRRVWQHQMNLARNQRKHNDYKMLLVDKLTDKEIRVGKLTATKNHWIEHGQRMNQTMQEQFYRTTATTKNAILPQPFEKHKKEFDALKEVKQVEKTED